MQKLKEENKNLRRNFEEFKEEYKKYYEYQLKQKDGIIDQLNDTIKNYDNENIQLRAQLEESAKVIWPQIDLLKTAEKYGTYKVLLTYEQVCTLRALFKEFSKS